MSTTSRLGLLGAAVLFALSAGLPGPARAQNTAGATLDNNAAVNTSVITFLNAEVPAPTPPDPPVPVVVDLESVFGSTAAAVTDGAFVFGIVDAGGAGPFDVLNNQLTARARGNDSDTSVGVTDSAGAMIFIGQQALSSDVGNTALFATLNDSVAGIVLNGSASGLASSVSGNRGLAYTTFNSAFSTIDADVPADLDALAGNYLAVWDLGGVGAGTYFPTDLEQTANFNVTTVQVNNGFENGNAADLPTSSIDDTVIVLAYLVDPAVVPSEVSGVYTVDLNSAGAQTQGNAADNSIFLFDGGASTLTGSALVSATQLSTDSTAPTGAFPGISAANQDTIIGAVFAAEPQGNPPPLSFGPPDIVSAVDLSASVSGNSVLSNATINFVRNTVGLEGTLDVEADAAGTVSTGAGTIAGAGDTEVNALIAAISNQTAASGITTTGGAGGQLTGGSNPQSAVALTEAAVVGIALEDADADTALRIGDNTISATATGQSAGNAIVNNGEITDGSGNVTNLGAGVADLTGTFATVNRQLLVHPDISAVVVDSTILALVGSSDFPGSVGPEAFGGLADSSTLIVGDNPATTDENEGNLFLASATGNGASSIVDLEATSFLTGGTGLVETANNEGIGAFTESDSNAGINMVNWQFQNLAGDGDNGSIFAQLDNVDINVFVNYAQGTVGTEEEIEITDANIFVNRNGGTAGASLNSYFGSANINASLGFDGTIAQLSHQYASGAGDSQYDVESEVVRTNISVDLGITGAAEDVNASVNANSYAALASGNESVQSLTVSAGTSIDVDADTIGGDNAVIASNVTDPNIETRVTDLEAAAAFIAVSDQTLRVAEIDALVSDVELELLLAAAATGTNSLEGGVLSLSGNQLLAQVVGNNASNSVSVSSTTGIDAIADSGAIAAAVSSQSSVRQEDDPTTPLLSGASAYTAEVSLTSIHADVMTVGTVDSVSGAILNVQGNAVAAVTYGNSVSNTVGVTSSDVNAAVTTGVSLESFYAVGEDMDLVVDDAALYVLNRQRNEANDTDFQLGPSATSLVSGNSVTATLNGGTVGTESVQASLSTNAIQGAAAGNFATNTVNLNAGTTAGSADAAAGILNRQGNSGNIEADVDGANTIQASVLGTTTATHSDLALNVNSNEISASATGSQATNRINAAGATLNGTVADVDGGVYIGLEASAPAGTIASVLTDVVTFDSNAESFATGNLAILNTQRNYGIPGADGPDTPNLINSEVEGSVIGLNVPGAAITTQSSNLSLSLNRVISQAGANQAINEINVLPTTTGPAAATVLNNQGVALTQVSSAATDTTVALNIDNAFDGGTSAVNGNTVQASASLNSATNTVTAQSNVGSLPSSTIVNYQTASDSSVSASNTGTSITHTAGLAGTGTFSGTATLSGNQIGSSATINSSTNKISAPGQTFTRTSSF